jgi:hypothetical protein
MALRPETRCTYSKFKRKARARTASRHVVMEVREQPLKARVEIWSERNEEDLEVDLIQAERVPEPTNPQIIAVSECDLRSLPELFPGGRDFRGGDGIEARRRPEELIHLRVGDVQAAEPIIRVRVAGPAPLHGQSNAGLNNGEATEQVCQ